MRPAADVWAIGLIAFEMLTGERVFPPMTDAHDILNAVAGRAPAALPWEGARAPELLRRLRVFRPHVLECLQRDPARRPAVSALVRGWNHLFKAATTAVPPPLSVGGVGAPPQRAGWEPPPQQI